MIVGRNHTVGDRVTTKVARQRLERSANVTTQNAYLSVHEHLLLLQKTVTKLKRDYPHFKGVSVTLTTPRSAHLYRNKTRQYAEHYSGSMTHPTQTSTPVIRTHVRDDPFPVPYGLSFFSLEAFLDAALDLHYKPDLAGLITGLDFVGPEQKEGRPFAHIYQLLRMYHDELLKGPYPIAGHFHGVEFPSHTNVVAPDDTSHLSNMRYIVRADKEKLIQVTRIGHGLVDC
jgi:hypothetical protein